MERCRRFVVDKHRFSPLFAQKVEFTRYNVVVDDFLAF